MSDLFWSAAAEAASTYSSGQSAQSAHRMQLGSAGDSDYLYSDEEDDAALDYIISTLSPIQSVQPSIHTNIMAPCSPPGVVDRETIGARRKGRRKGCKNKTPEERKAILGEKDKLKNEKERERVKNIQQQYQKLRVMLGDPTPHKKLCKQQVLNATIGYINDLLQQLSTISESTVIKKEPIRLRCDENIPILGDSADSSPNSAFQPTLYREPQGHIAPYYATSPELFPSPLNYLSPYMIVSPSIPHPHTHVSMLPPTTPPQFYHHNQECGASPCVWLSPGQRF